MTNCTSTGRMIFVRSGARLAMQDCRVFGNRGSCRYCGIDEKDGDHDFSKVDGVRCIGTLDATATVFEDIGGNGVKV